jgi:hypothetical protein
MNENITNNSVYDVLDDMEEDISGGMKDKILGDEASSSSSDPYDVKFTDALGAISLVGRSFGLVKGIMNAIGTTLGIDGRIVAGIFVAFIISIVFAIIYLIFRFR